MNDPFVSWAESYIGSIESRLPWLEQGRITMSEMRDGERIDRTAEFVKELKRQREELRDLVETHRRRNA